MPDPLLRAALAAAVLCIALAGCASGPPSLIVLQDPVSGRIVPCGPPPDTATADPSGEAARCAASFERQGYHPLPVETQ